MPAMGNWLAVCRFTTLRCWNHDVLQRTDLVLEMILQALQ